MSGNVLIPGGELGLVPPGTYTDKNGNLRPSPARVWITFGKMSACFRADQVKALFKSIEDNPSVREFLGVDE